MNKAFIPPPQAHQSNHPIGSPHSVSESFSLSPYRTDNSNASAVESAKNGTEKPSKINGQKIAISEARSALPLNLLGGGSHRFPGSWTVKRTDQVAAIVAAEIDPVISREGVPTYRVPRRRT